MWVDGTHMNDDKKNPDDQVDTNAARDEVIDEKADDTEGGGTNAPPVGPQN